ncbi:unnamed protein product [Ilex paraguariensis]|uniref:Letm1 RBD domain-containing protein n=1 Tax=Ilex paraguariensis TaxID=185542 RepID=A0ABC8R9X4_9AQUA
MAKEVQTSQSGEIKKTAEDLDEFLNRVRRGTDVSNEEILSFAKLFNDELTLDNISRPRLVNMCKYMGIQSFGTDAYLRYMLRKRLQSLSLRILDFEEGKFLKLYEFTAKQILGVEMMLFVLSDDGDRVMVGILVTFN